LKRNVLVIGTTGRETPFLGEGDVPEHARLNRTIEPNQPSEDQQLAEALQRSAQEAAGLSRLQSCVISVCLVKYQFKKMLHIKLLVCPELAAFKSNLYIKQEVLSRTLSSLT